MNTTSLLSNPNSLTSNIERVKTLHNILSKYSIIPGKVNYAYIPANTVLEVTEVYPNYGVDVFYGDRNIYLDFEEIVVLQPS